MATGLDARGERPHGQAEVKPLKHYFFQPSLALFTADFALDIVIVRNSEQFEPSPRPNGAANKAADEKSTAVETSAETLPARSRRASRTQALPPPEVVVNHSEGPASGAYTQRNPAKNVGHNTGRGPNPGEHTAGDWRNERDLIAEVLSQTIDNARILLIEYPGQLIAKKKSIGSVSEIADGVKDLVSRARTNRPNRPIMFIGDNLGVAAIKECLMLCGKVNVLQKSILWMTIGIVTLLTPRSQLDRSDLILETLEKVLSNQTDRPPMHAVLTATMQSKSTKRDSTHGTTETEYIKVTSRELQHRWLPSRTDYNLSIHSNNFEKFYEWHADWRPAMVLATVTLGGRKDYSKVANTVQTGLDAHCLLDMAQNGEADTLKSLLERRKYANINSLDGMWRSVLHLAARDGQLDIIKILDGRGDASFFSKKDKNGRNALHYAALYCLDDDKLTEIVRILVNGGIDLDTRDNSGLSARQAATNRRVAWQLLQRNSPYKVSPSKIVSPHNIPSFQPEKPSLLAGQVCRGFRATLVESYSNDEEGERIYIQQPSIWELLYQEHGRLDRFFPINRNKSSDDLNMPADTLQFRWFHLPVNHVGWVRDLFAQMKVKTEPPEYDQHAGDTPWSLYMRPQARNFEYEQYVPDVERPSSNGDANLIKRERGKKDLVMFIPFLNFEMECTFDTLRQDTAKKYPPSRWKDLAEGQEQSLRQRPSYYDRQTLPIMEQGLFRGESEGDFSSSTATPSIRVAKRDFADDGVGVWNPDEPIMRLPVRPTRIYNDDPLGLEAKLVYGYPREETSDFHPRRTLDQAHYPMLPDTRRRDGDQVVLRRQKGEWPGQKIERNKIEKTPRLIMVDQLWIWVIGDTIVTSFPQKWRTECDVLEQLLLHLKKAQRPVIPTTQDFVDLIIKSCVGIFNRPDPRATLDLHGLFEQTVGNVADLQMELFRDFESQLQLLSQDSTKEKEKSKGMDKMFAVEKDIMLLEEVRDLRDELKMVLRILEDQATTVREMLGILHLDESAQEQPGQAARPKIQPGTSPSTERAGAKGNSSGHLAWRRQKQIEEQFRRRYGVIEVNIRDFTRMLAHVDTSYEEANSLLDLKQKQLNVLEARAARQGANTILVFTIATILFGGLSFVTAFFALNVAAFPHQADDNTVWNLGYVIGYVAAISLGLTLPFMLWAFWVNVSQETVGFLERMWNWVRRKSHRRQRDLVWHPDDFDDYFPDYS